MPLPPPRPVVLVSRNSRSSGSSPAASGKLSAHRANWPSFSPPCRVPEAIRCSTSSTLLAISTPCSALRRPTGRRCHGFHYRCAGPRVTPDPRYSPAAAAGVPRVLTQMAQAPPNRHSAFPDPLHAFAEWAALFLGGENRPDGPGSRGGSRTCNQTGCCREQPPASPSNNGWESPTPPG